MLLLEDERLAPEWASPHGRFALWVPWLWAGNGDGERLASFLLPDGRRLPALTRTAHGLSWHFAPKTTIRHLLAERYYRPSPPPHNRFPIHHHHIPGRLRVAAARLLTAWQRRREDPHAFPGWPIVDGVEGLRGVVARAQYIGGQPGGGHPGTGHPPASQPIWPGGKRFAVTLTHDVDTAKGLRQAPRIAALERPFGYRSAWFVVPQRFALDHGVLRALWQEGHEIGCHGYDHRNRMPFLEAAEIRERVDRCRPFLEQYGVSGYRSPGLLRTKTLYTVLSSRFTYDTSIPDTEWYSGLAPHNGCCTVFPFWRDGLLILPATVPLDALLIHYGYTPQQILQTWRTKLRWIANVGGLATITTHSETHYSANPEMLALYRDLLAELAGRDDAWFARPVDIARWWLANRPDVMAAHPSQEEEINNA